MSIFGFVRETRKKKFISNHPSRHRSDVAVSPLDSEPDDPGELADMLRRSYDLDLLEEISYSKPVSTPFLYTVKPGDTLNSISKKYYEDKDACTKILSANGSILKFRNIFVGQILRMPPRYDD